MDTVTTLIVVLLGSAVVSAIVANRGEQGRAREERRQTRLAETYLAVIRLVLSASDYVERTHPMGSLGAPPEPPQFPSDEEQRLVRARLAAFGTQAMRDAYQRWGDAFYEFRVAVTTYDAMHDGAVQTGQVAPVADELTKAQLRVYEVREKRVRPAGHDLVELANGELAERRASRVDRAREWVARNLLRRKAPQVGSGTVDLATGVVEDFAMAKPTHLDHLSTILSQLDSRLAMQIDEWDGLDRKGTTIMATTGVVLGLVVNSSTAFQKLPDPAPGVFVAALAALVAGLAAGVITLWPRGFQAVPDPQRLLAYVEKDTETLVGTLISTKAEAFKRNRDPMKWKVRIVRAQMLLLTVAAVLLFLILWYWR